jgi:hypothetical protein
MDDQQESEERLPDELEELQRALKLLEPLPGRLDRSRLIYLAGRASAGVAPSGTTAARAKQKRNWAWPASTAAMTLVAATLAVALAVRPPPRQQIVRETVYVKQPALDASDIRRTLVFDPAPQQPASVDEPGGVLTAPFLGMSMQRAVLEQGADALPDVVLTGIDPPSTSRQMLESLLDVEPGSRTRNGERPGPIKFDWKSFIFPGGML